MEAPLWSLTNGCIEYDDNCTYNSWDEFISAEPWDCNALACTIPTFWKVYNPDDPTYDEEYDTPSLGLVYTSIAPLRAYSVYVALDAIEDQTKIKEWLVKHGFITRGG